LAFVSTTGGEVPAGVVEIVLGADPGSEVSILSSRCFGADGRVLDGSEARLVVCTGGAP
jgi:hypothetical protein